MKEDDELPFFPNVHGEVVDEEIMLQFTKKLAEITGQPTCTPDGVELLGRHSFRATGAVYLSSIGVNIHKIGLLARWSSPAITHYTRVAPLQSLTE